MENYSWFTSSYSSPTGQCVQCAHIPDGGMAVRDSKDTAGPALAFPRKHWQVFLREVSASRLPELSLVSRVTGLAGTPAAAMGPRCCQGDSEGNFAVA
jgi:hypothetical protein